MGTRGKAKMTMAHIERLKKKGLIKDFVEKTRPPEATKKKQKYGNTKVLYNDILFDSIKECEHYKILKLREHEGQIKDVETQVVFTLNVNDKKVCNYIADFRYTDCKTGLVEVIDVKSEATRKLPTYRLKKKLMASALGINIIEA